MFKYTLKRLAATLLLAAATVAHVAAGPGQDSGSWELVAPPSEGFTVRLPLKPEEQSDRIPFEGKAYLMRMYTAPDKVNGTLYMVIMQEFASVGAALDTSERFENFIIGFKEGMAKTLGTSAAPMEMKADADLNLKGNFGRQYLLSFGSTRGLVRGYTTKDRIYVLVAIGGNAGNESTKRFFDSFDITPAPAPMPMPITK